MQKTSAKWANFHKNMPNVPLAVNWNGKSAIKTGKKAICKTELCKKQAQKTSKFQLKQAQKQATRKSSKKTRNSTEKQAQIRGENARLVTLMKNVTTRQRWSDGNGNGCFIWLSQQAEAP